MQNNKLAMLGIAAKAGKVMSGEFSTEKAVKEGRAYLVIVANDASDNTKKLFSDKCSYYDIPILISEDTDKDSLGHMIGKKSRASLAVTDEGLANAILKRFA